MYAVMDGEKIQEMRAERGLSRRQFAQAVGLAQSTLRSAEQGGTVRLLTVRKLAAYFGTQPKEIARPQHKRGGQSR
jgi:DNA-binding XRE family transcriptional regulator